MYQTGFITELEGLPFLTRRKLSIKPRNGDNWHIVTKADKIDALAWQYYKPFTKNADKLWWIIADANNISNPSLLSNYAGRFLLIPEFFRVQRLIDETRSDNFRTYDIGELVENSEITEGYSINEIYPISLASGGSGDILPDYSDRTDPPPPTPKTNEVRLFLKMKGGGGFVKVWPKLYPIFHHREFIFHYLKLKISIKKSLPTD